MRILIIDNNELTLFMKTSLLEEHGFQCEVYRSPVSAAFALARNPDRLAAVITAHRMRGLNGLQVMRLCSYLAPGIPVILVGEDVEPDKAYEFLKLGGHALLDDPPQPGELLQAIASASRRQPIFECLPA